MKTTIHIIIIAWIILISSCKKNDVNRFIFAGKYDSSYIFQEFSLVMKIQISWDSINLYGSGIDSLDVNFDNNYDIFFYLYIYNSDNWELLDGFPEPFPKFYVECKNGLSVAYYTKQYYAGQGASQEGNFAFPYIYDQQISINHQWESEDINKTKLWAENPTGWFPFGDWYYATEIRYLGIKMKDQLGWIEIDNSSPYGPKFMSFALQKN